MKKKISLILAALLLVAAIFGGVYASAEEPATEAPTMKIKGAALILGNSVDIQYIEELDGIEASDVKLLVWDSVPSEYAYGTQKYTVSYINGDTLKSGGVTYPYFRFTNAGAKMMTKDYYAVLYATTDEGAIYSSPVKYSILNYAYNKLGKTGTVTTNENLKELLVDMLEYGASAQKYLGYETERLANGAFYQVKVSGGTLDDGFKTGLYLEGETVKLTAPLTNDGGEEFLSWVDSLGYLVGADAESEMTVGTKNETYTARYGECESHIMTEWQIGKEETCAEAGFDIRNCLTCGKAETKERPALPHANYTDGVCVDCGSVVGSQGLTYSLQSDGTYAVSGIGTCRDTDVKILPTHNGAAVTKITASAFNGRTTLTSISVPDSVTLIDSAAFSGCSSLESITLPFVGGSKKTSTDTYQYPFGYIFGTSNYTGGVATEQFYYGKSTSSTTSSTYYIPSTLKNVTITGGNILCGAFYNCAFFTNVTIPNDITSIGMESFYHCTALTEITIPDGVTTIKSSAFKGCDSLTSVAIPSSVTELGGYAFDCSNLTGVYITDLAKWCDLDFSTIYANPLFNAKNLYLNGELVTDLVIPEGVTEIGSCAFTHCINLTSVTIPSNVITIGSAAFAHCSGLTSVTIENGVTTIGTSAFTSCTALTSVTIPNSVTTIGTSAFRDCSKLASITIPESVTKIGDRAFLNCTSLKSVTFVKPSGWKLPGGTSLLASELSDKETAAYYLRSQYSTYSWTKS